MIKNKQTFFLGIFIIIVCVFFGIPKSWKVFISVLSAIYLIVISIKIDLPKRSSLKPVRRKGKATQVFVENAPMPKIDSVTAPVAPKKEEL